MTTGRGFIIAHIALAIALMCFGLFGLDRVIAESLRTTGWEGFPFLIEATRVLDIATGKELSKFLIGLLLCSCAAGLLLSARTRAVGRNVLFVGMVQLLGTLIAGISKNFFGRLRPFELLQSGDWNHEWLVGGGAFPSGHAGFYFGLFMPLAYLFPRWRWPLMIVPWFIAIARINANHHFVSDVAASIALVGVLTLLFARLTEQRSHGASRAEGLEVASG